MNIKSIYYAICTNMVTSAFLRFPKIKRRNLEENLTKKTCARETYVKFQLDMHKH